MPKHANKFSDTALLDLYKKGLTDRDIGLELGVSQSAVNYRREKLGLPSNYINEKISNEDITSLNEKGYTDKEISKMLGVSQSSINYRRQKLGLASNYKKDKFSQERLMALYNDGQTDRDIAQSLGVTPAAVNYRRERLGYKSNSKPIDLELFSSLFLSGYPIENIAFTMRISLSKAYNAREELLWKRRSSHVYSDQEGM